MRVACLVLAFLISMPLAAQDAKKKKKQLAHKKPTAEQIRKFKQLEKKQ